VRNKEIEEDKKKFLDLIHEAGFKDIKQFADNNEIGLKYSAITKWGVEKDKKGRLRPFPKWIFSWLRLYIENKKLSRFKEEKEIIIENIRLRKKMKSILSIIKSR